VNTYSAFMGSGVDEGISAKKKQIYEAFLAKGETRVVVPAANRYMDDTIRAAGFEPYDDAAEGAGLDENYSGKPRKVTLQGSKDRLAYDYNFANRDGSERPTDSKAAEVLVQLLQPLSQMPGVLQGLGTQRVYALLNAIVRLAGVGVDLKFDVEDGQSDTVPHGDAALDGKDAIETAITKILDAVAKNEAQVAQLEQAVMGMPSGIPQSQPMPGGVMPAAA
jgi:hypothetical protein